VGGWVAASYSQSTQNVPSEMQVSHKVVNSGNGLDNVHLVKSWVNTESIIHVKLTNGNITTLWDRE